MHDAVLDWVGRYATSEPVSVLDIGGRDLNGSTRHLFPKADPYVALDLRVGDSVDVVADAATWTPDQSYDVVLCTEVFEHAPAWRDIVATAYRATAPGGMFVATAAAPGRGPHSGITAGPIQPGEYYAEISRDELAEALRDAGFTTFLVDVQATPADVRCMARRES